VIEMDGRVGIRAHWSFQQVSPHSLSLSLSLLLLSYYYYYEYANLLYPVLPAASIHILLVAILLILLSLSHYTLIAISHYTLIVTIGTCQYSWALSDRHDGYIASIPTRTYQRHSRGRKLQSMVESKDNDSSDGSTDEDIPYSWTSMSNLDEEKAEIVADVHSTWSFPLCSIAL
jgi:hypothetical protein